MHWVVDDTWWDHRPPDDDIGRRLRDRAEVDAIKAVLAPLLEILADLGPSQPDADYFRHPRWEDVRHSAQAAAALLRRNDAGAGR